MASNHEFGGGLPTEGQPSPSEGASLDNDQEVLPADLVELLVAYDEALALGKEEDAELKARLAGLSMADECEFGADKECLRLLGRLWPGTRATGPGSDKLKVSEVRALPCGTKPANGSGLVEPGVVGDRRHVQRLGRFEILRELGRGGGGIVFEAIDPKLGRRVALKVPRPEFIWVREYRRRFLLEGRAAAKLDHPNIVTVFETGKVSLVCYIASTFCQGPTLASWMRSQDRPLAPDTAAQLVVRLAEAVEHAHGRGVLHRDLKPSNVLLERRETLAKISGNGSDESPPEQDGAAWLGFIPRLTDFGLAKFIVGNADETRTGAVLGTPAYMAPEQAEGRLHDVGPATDIYALGVILYELLTGSPPFEAESDLGTLHQVAYREPRRPRAFRSALACDLEAICLKCLEKEVTRRYARAADLADDLRRYLAHLPTRARPLGIVPRACRWARRRPVVVAAIAVSAISIAALFCGAVWHRLSLARRDHAVADMRREVRQNRQLRQNEDYVDSVRGAYQAWQNGDVQSALDQLARHEPPPGQEDLRGFEWCYVRRLCEGGIRTIKSHDGRVYSVTFSPDDGQLASCGDDRKIRFWNWTTGQLRMEIDTGSERVRSIAFSPDGRLLAAALEESDVKVWQVETRQLHGTLSGHTGQVECVAFSPDGETVATGGADRTVRLWNVAACQQQAMVAAHRDPVRAITFSSDGRLLASGSTDQIVKIWNSSLVEPVRTLDAEREIHALRFSPDGQMLAGGLSLWDVSTGKRLAFLGGHKNHVRSLAFSADGTLLASGSWDSTIRIWDTRSRSLEHVLRAHTESVESVAFAANGTTLATGGWDGTIRLWDASVSQEGRPLPVNLLNGHAAEIALSPDGDTLAITATNTDATGADVGLWSISEQKWIAARTWPGQYLRLPRFSSNGEHLVLVGDADVLLWNVRNDEVRHLTKTAQQRTDCAFSPDSTLVALAGHGPSDVQLLEVATGKEVGRLPGRRCVSFSPDGRLLAMESTQAFFAVQIWDLSADRSLCILSGHEGEIYSATFSGDGQLLATASGDGTVRVWDWETRRARFTLRGHEQGVRHVAFSPDGRSLISVGPAKGEKVICWNVATGRPVLSFPIAGDWGHSAIFSRDGQILFTCSHYVEQRSQVGLWFAPRRALLREER